MKISPPTVTADAIASGPFLALILDAFPGERVVPDVDGTWIAVRSSRATPEQGWKLHVSATIISAEHVLRQIIPVLAVEDVSFKVATPATLMMLNQGMSGLSQVGKFVSVYPRDDAQAVRLAVALDEATRHLPGPAVPSDRPLRAGSLVHYRYGAFGGIPVQIGERGVQWFIRTPDGGLEPDERLPYFRAPSWVSDPFLQAGAAILQPQSALIGGCYMLTATLHASARGSVHTALDTITLAPRVLKRAARHGAVGPDGRDARDRLRTEYSVLSSLAPDQRFPAVHDLIEQDGDLYLAMEDIRGETLAAHVSGLQSRGMMVTPRQIVAWGRELATALHRVHQLGYLLSDLKPANIMVTPSGRLRLVDFDAARPLDSDRSVYVGTRGYVAPERLAGRSTDVTADVYSLGAVLYFTATGAEAWQAPSGRDLLQRPMTLLNPGIPEELDHAITICLDPDPAARPASMDDVDALLAAVTGKRARRARPAPAPEGDPLRMAERLGDSICRAARPDAAGLWWPAQETQSAPFPLRTLYGGCAGIVLALATLVETLGRPRHREVLTEGARWLSTAPSPEGEVGVGLYDGEAGIALALLRAGQALADDDLIQQAVAIGRFIAFAPHRGLDLISGTAGRLRCHLWLWSATGESEALDAAVKAGEVILAAAEPAGDGLRWTDDTLPVLPDDRPADGSAPAWLGYAHGAAGIGDALLDLWEATGDERFRGAAAGAARRLADLATSAPGNRSAISWPRTEGGRTARAFWCHGAGGIGRFFLHAARRDLIPEAEELAQRAALTVQSSTRWAPPTLCHGLAGNLAFLQEMYRQTGDRRHQRGARDFHHLLRAWMVERNGSLVCAGDEPTVFSPAYMVGYAGVAASLLRLVAPGDLPDLARVTAVRA